MSQIPGAWGGLSFLKWLRCEHENLSLDPPHLHKNQAWGTGAYNPSVGGPLGQADP